ATTPENPTPDTPYVLAIRDRQYELQEMINDLQKLKQKKENVTYEITDTEGLSGVCPFCVKRRGIVNGTMDAIKRPGNKGAGHEHFILTGKRSFNPQYRRCGKSEPGVIRGMPHHDHNPVPQLPARPEAFLYKTGPNTLTLICGTYGKR